MGNIMKRTSLRVVPYDEDYYMGNAYSNDKNIPIAHGSGKYVDEQGNTYLGDFSNHKFEGEGTMQYNVGHFMDENYEPIDPTYEHLPVMYVGTWKGGFRHGTGKAILLNGSTYEGTFNYDEIHGRGKLTYNNGDYYIGEFNCGIQYGTGSLYASNHVKLYEGHWVNNAFHGKGSYFFPNGNIHYKGNWYNSLAHGIGILYKDTKDVDFYGLFEHGDRVEDYMKQGSSWNITLTSLVKDKETPSPKVNDVIITPTFAPSTPPIDEEEEEEELESFTLDKLPIQKTKTIFPQQLPNQAISRNVHNDSTITNEINEFVSNELELTPLEKPSISLPCDTNKEDTIISPKPVNKESMINPIHKAMNNSFIVQKNNPLRHSSQTKTKTNPLHGLNIIPKIVTPPVIPNKTPEGDKSPSKLNQFLAALQIKKTKLLSPKAKTPIKTINPMHNTKSTVVKINPVNNRKTTVVKINPVQAVKQTEPIKEDIENIQPLSDMITE